MCDEEEKPTWAFWNVLTQKQDADGNGQAGQHGSAPAQAQAEAVIRQEADRRQRAEDEADPVEPCGYA